jgi:plastocyanin
MRRLLALTAALLLAVTVLGACGDDEEAGPEGGDTSGDTAAGGEEEVQTIAVTGKEDGPNKYSFQLASATAKGGVAKVDFTNAGQEPHQATLIRLEGKTYADFTAELAKPDAKLPDWAKSAGGVAIANPGGGKASSTQDLEEGTYVLGCFIPGPNGQPHAAGGMITELKVEGDEGGEHPEADAEITAKNFTFDVPELKAGQQTIEVKVAEGGDDHEAVLVQLQPGKKGADVAAFFGPNAPQGPPPFIGFPGGLAPVEPGGEGYIDVNLLAGEYSLLCFVEAADGQPHFAKGMSKDFKVA